MPGKPCFWANQADAWKGNTHRENSLKRWAEHLQNDFAARMDWCVKSWREANHPPEPRVAGPPVRRAAPGERVVLDGSASSDPDGDAQALSWAHYAEPGGQAAELVLENAGSPRATFTVPEGAQSLHFILTATDRGTPPLTRYRRVIVEVRSR